MGRSWAKLRRSRCPSVRSRTRRASARRRERLRGQGAGGETPAPLPGRTPQPPALHRSHGAVEVAHHAGGLPRRGVPKAGVVHVADDALEPGQGPGRGQRLVGEVACGGGRDGSGGAARDPRGHARTRAGRCQRSPGSPPPPRFVIPGATQGRAGAPRGSHTKGVPGGPPPEGTGHSHSCCLKGGWDCRTEIKMKKRKRGHRSSMASWIWGTPTVGGGPSPHRCPGLPLHPQQDPEAPGALPPRVPAHPLPPAVGEVLPEQQPQLGAHGHGGGAGGACPAPRSAAGEHRGVSAALGAPASLRLRPCRTLAPRRAQG